MAKRFYIKINESSFTVIQIIEASDSTTLQAFLSSRDPNTSYIVIKSVETGDAIFNASNTQNIIFADQFLQIPLVTLTMGGNAISQVYKINATRNGFTIKFLTNFTGTVSWSASDVR